MIKNVVKLYRQLPGKFDFQCLGCYYTMMNKRTTKEQLLAWLPALVCMVVIYAASATPSNRIQNFGAWDTLVKKGGHFIGYAFLGITYLIGIGGRRQRAWMIAIPLAILYAASDELHQFYTPGRHSRLVDVGIDGIGAVSGVWLWIRMRAGERINWGQLSRNGR